MSIESQLIKLQRTQGSEIIQQVEKFTDDVQGTIFKPKSQLPWRKTGQYFEYKKPNGFINVTRQTPPKYYKQSMNFIVDAPEAKIKFNVKGKSSFSLEEPTSSMLPKKDYMMIYAEHTMNFINNTSNKIQKKFKPFVDFINNSITNFTSFIRSFSSKEARINYLDLKIEKQFQSNQFDKANLLANKVRKLYGISKEFNKSPIEKISTSIENIPKNIFGQISGTKQAKKANLSYLKYYSAADKKGMEKVATQAGRIGKQIQITGGIIGGTGAGSALLYNQLRGNTNKHQEILQLQNQNMNLQTPVSYRDKLLHILYNTGA